MNYGLYYSYLKGNDVLVVRFSAKEVTYEKKFKDILVSFANTDIVSYTIYNFKDIIKIHGDGLIALPNDIMIDVINGVLIRNGLSPIERKEHSDFYVGKVISLSPLTLKTSLGNINLSKDYDVKLNDRVVMAKNGAFLFDESQCEEDIICSLKQLGISSSDAILKDNSLDINKDFFQTEAK